MSYEPFADRYATHAASSLHNARYERPAMAARFGDLRGVRVLDAGCAAGETIATLLAAGARVVALDVSARMVARVAERFADEDVRAVRADLAAPLPFADGSFDLVVCSLALHYVADWETPLREFRRILVGGGRLLISTHHPAMSRAFAHNYFAREAVEDVWTLDGERVVVRFFHRPLAAMIDAFLAAGFSLRALVEPHLDAAAAEAALAAGHDAARVRELAREPWFVIFDLDAPQ